MSFTLRLPATLKAHLADAALRHGRSLNAEIVRQLAGPMGVDGWQRQLRRDLMALRPVPDDSRSDAEVAHQMERVYARWGLVWPDPGEPDNEEEAAS